MAKFLYSAATSVDGFIAGPGGDMGWLTDYLGPNPVVDELVPQVGALLVGRRTYGATIRTGARRLKARRSAGPGTARNSY